VDNQYQLDPVGIQCSRIEGNFLNILWRKTFYRNINQCFDNAGIAIAEMYLSPLALADSVLTDAEKRGGCVLIDLGADTTTVAVYYKKILRNLTVVPLGSNNITKDIASLQMEEKDAEQMKLKYASAYTDASEIDAAKVYPIDNDRTIDQRKFVEIVEARVQEIIENAWCQVPVDYVDKLLGGIILTGGGSNMRNIERAFNKYTHIEKIRVAKFVSQTIHSNNPSVNAKDATMCTILSLLAKGDMNCAGAPISDDLFASGNNDNKSQITAEPRKPKPLEGTGTGKVLTEAEKAAEEAAREAARKAAEEKARAEAQAAAEAEEEERRKKRENSAPRKAWRAFKKFVGNMIEEEDEK